MPTTTLRRIRLVLAAAGTAAALLLAGCAPLGDDAATPGTSGRPRHAGGVSAADASTAATMGFDYAQVRDDLAAIEVRQVDAYNDYDRVGDFGEAWADVDGNGCDTRSDVLRRDLVDITLAGRCKVDAGTLHDPYSGGTVHYVRGEQSSQAVQIDHVVPLYEAWRTGAQSWSVATRLAFANDPLNLLAVDGDANGDKGDLDPSRWLPEPAGYRCAYVARYVEVKHEYGLWVTGREHSAIADVLDGCDAS